jgi:hypothetical protein
MRKILFSLIAALMATTALAKGGPPTVRVHYDLGLFTVSKDVDPREAGEILAQCHSNGEAVMLGITVPCAGLDLQANPGGAREITIYLGLPF